MTRSRRHAGVVVFAAWCAACAGVARGDELLVNKLPIHRVRVVDYNRGIVEYRTAAGDYERVKVAQVDMFVIDSVAGAEDFNAAEEFLLKDRPAQAVDRYEKALRTSRGIWADLAQVRLLIAADRAGLSEKAIRAAIAIIESDPETGALLLPTAAPASEDRTARRSLTRIDAALTETHGPARSLVELLRYQFLRALGDAEADQMAASIASLQLPSGFLTVRTAAIKTDALESLRRAGRHQEVIDAVNAMPAGLPVSMEADWLMMKADSQYAIATDEPGYFEAALTAMRVAIGYRNSEVSGRALLLAAKAHEDTGRRGDAVRLLRECLARDAVTESDKERARAALERLTGRGAKAS